MLTIEQLKQYYPATSGNELPLKRILIEYLQYELLSSIFAQPAAKNISFMGGTAVRICYNNNRFSEDLDFDNFGLSFAEFQKLLDRVIADMYRKGFETEFRFVEKGAYHCYVKFPQILSEYNLAVAKEEKILIRIDTVRKEKIFQPQIITINKFDLYFDILVNPADIILTQKLIAILQRKRAKGRDFYDVSFLYSFTEPNQDYITGFLNSTPAKFAKQLINKCHEMDYSQLTKDVEPLLINPELKARVTNFLPFIEEKLQDW
ncbi:MAG: nucleotidyl transferase AbiEii/AbiGii toxin family protein [Patescibacteria group bacterium]